MQEEERHDHRHVMRILMLSGIVFGFTAAGTGWAADPGSDPSAQPPVSSSAPSAPAQGQSGAMQGTMHIREVCGADIKQFCSNVQPGSGRIITCLEQHQAEVSAGCHQLIEKYQSRKGKSH